MDKKEINKKFSTIDYAVIKELDISVAEAAYLDMVYYLSRAGSEWCYKSLQAIADDFNAGKSTIKSMRDRLIEKELLVRSKEGWVKTTEPVHLSYGVRKSHDKPSSVRKSSHIVRKTHATVRKTHKNRAKSNPKIYIESNNKINIETPAADLNGAGFKKYQAQRRKLGL